MQNQTQTGLSLSNVNTGGVSTMNGSANNNIYVSSNLAAPDNFIFEEEDPSLEDDESDSDIATFQQGHGIQQNATNSGLKPGKKTKGRVKIKMEFIENKLRRYTTFSKRKTGIMKKAYELSTLTGTQVMLLVASETGHVYTFATRKLQPMITSESGKALIQTCLNSPDPPPGSSSGNVLEQRMNPSGFEETDLSCAVGEDEQIKTESCNTLKTVFPMPTQVSTVPGSEQLMTATSREQVSQMPTYTIQTAPVSLASREQSSGPVMSKTYSLSSNTSNSTNPTTSSFQTMQIPILLQNGTTISMLQASNQSLGQAIAVTQSQSGLKTATLSQVVSAHNNQLISSSQNNQTGELNTPLPVSTPSAISFMQGMTPGIVMYHTPQGVVYATPTQNLHDRTIFNFPQTTAAISMSQPDQSTGQQIITIPVPVSLSGTPLLQLAQTPSIESSSGESLVQQQPPNKKVKK
ncbi:unnamed protein product [Lymnaea stagnalis]|uniref:MADS-box domain-containing protein n=1 Tax=Lymnaea stagnalis TaxID=6523 RepID=A0AAV2I2T3_LYMST